MKLSKAQIEVLKRINARIENLDANQAENFGVAIDTKRTSTMSKLSDMGLIRFVRCDWGVEIDGKTCNVPYLTLTDAGRGWLVENN